MTGYLETYLDATTISALTYGALGFVLGTLIVGALLRTRSRELLARIDVLKDFERKNKELDADLQRAREQSIKLNAEKELFEKRISEQKETVQKTEEAMLHKFENLSNKIFEEKNSSFKKESRESLDQLLSPLREKLTEFQKKVDDSFGQQTKEQYSLKEQIKNIVEAHDKMTQQTENLTKALKGDSKVQGDWGEVILENILEFSGLRKNLDYVVQGDGLDIRHADTGQIQKPDVVVNLPEGKHVIVDSKLSLRHYERFCSATEEEQRGLSLKQFILAVRDRVKELEQRRYQDTEKLGTPEIVLMFMPIEGAFALALQNDPELHQFAWSRKVAIVCPTTLFATLKTISSLWRLELQNNNAQEIAKQGGALYDKVEGFVTDMQALGKQLKTVEGTYDSAMNKLATGRGNILGRTEKLKKLGAKTSKSLPAELIDAEEILEIDREKKIA